MRSPSWVPIRRALMDQRKRYAERLTEPADEANGKDEADRAQASLRLDEQTLTRHRAQDKLKAIDRALARLDAGVYASCIECGGEIGTARLTVLLTVETCVACQHRREVAARAEMEC